jgi:cell shape-determining protein MreD
MFGVAMEWSPLMGLLWALIWGYVMDTLAGEFWGFHVGSYVVAICLVNIAAERFEFYNVLYQLAFVGVCALGQSVALGLFLSLASSGGEGMVWSMWASLLMRALLITALAPMILHPFGKMQKKRG